MDRDLERMKKIRHGENFQIENGLVMRQLPFSKKILYEEGTEDVLIYRRRKTNLEVDEETYFAS
jgi:hypothetical protein